MSTTVTYKDNTLTTVNNATKTLKTAGKYMEDDVILTDNSESSLQSKSATPTESAQTITADSGYDGLSSVSVGAISSTYVGSGITRRSSTDLTASGATVTVPAGYYSSQVSKAVASGSAGTPIATKGTISNHAISVTPSVTNTTGYITGGTKTGTAVSVSASELVSGTLSITSSGTKDVTNYASASIAAGGATASATKGTVSNHSVTITPSVTRTAGWVSAGSANGTAVTVSASELVSGTKSITTNGTSIDVTDYANVDVNVPNSHTITLSSNTTASGVYVQLNHTGTTYRNDGTTINFSNGDELYIYCKSGRAGGTITINGTTVVSDPSNAVEYTFELPNSDITVDIKYALSTATINVVIPSLGITTNGTYDVSEYALANVNVASSGGSGSPYYARAVVVPEQTVTLDSQKKASLNDVTIGLSINGFYIITFNGVEYYATCHALFDWYLCLGDVNVQLNPSDANSMTPFHIVSTQDMTKLSLTLWCKSDSASTVSIKIEQLFFTDEITVAENIASQQTVTLNSERMGSLTATGTITQGYHYAITFDDVEYVCTAALLWNGSEHAVGDRLLPFGGRDDYQYPFYIAKNGNNIDVMGITASTNHTVKVDRIELPEGGGITIDPLTVTSNGTYTAPTNHAYTPVTVNVSGGGGTYQAKTNISPTTSSQTIRPDSGYDALSSVQINAMPTGTAGTPSATKGSVSNHSITVTPSVTNTTGYITGSTKTGTAVTVSASELVSGSETKTANGTYNVTNLASLVVNIPIVTYHTSSSAPTSSQGSNGDLWLVTA